MPEADVTAQHRCAAKIHLTSLEHDRLVERQMFKFVVFAEEDAKQYGIAGDLHDHVHFIVLIAVASKTPAHTAIRHSTNDRPTLAPARNHSPSLARLSVCRLNDEKVV